jgi:hypothetical protein
MIGGASDRTVWLGLVIDVQGACVVETTGPCADYMVAKACAEYMAASARAEARRECEDGCTVGEYLSQVVSVDLSKLPGQALPQPAE